MDAPVMNDAEPILDNPQALPAEETAPEGTTVEPVEDGPAEGDEPEVEEAKKADPLRAVKHKIKVNGAELEIDYDELVARAQKGTDYTQKAQKLADERRQLQAQLQRPPKPPSLPELIQYAPDEAVGEITGIIGKIDAELRQAQQQQDVFKTTELLSQRQNLMDARDYATRLGQMRASAVAEVMHSIPDYPQRAEKLTQWVHSILPDDPLTEAELGHLTNPLNYAGMGGRTAVKMVKFINALYEKANAGEIAARTKIVKAAPANSPQGSSAAGGGKPDGGLAAAMAKAKKTGSIDDWAEYSRIKGELAEKSRGKAKE